MPIITPADLPCSSGQSDELVQCVIDSIQETIGACLDASYPECTAKLIFVSVACHILGSTDGGEVTSERAPNGASTTYANNGSGEGLKGTESGRLALSLDTKGCTSTMFADTFLFLAGGDVEPPNEW
jgi:hypothetical protein